MQRDAELHNGLTSSMAWASSRLCECWGRCVPVCVCVSKNIGVCVRSRQIMTTIFYNHNSMNCNPLELVTISLCFLLCFLLLLRQVCWGVRRGCAPHTPRLCCWEHTVACGRLDTGTGEHGRVTDVPRLAHAVFCHENTHIIADCTQRWMRCDACFVRVTLCERESVRACVV